MMRPKGINDVPALYVANLLRTGKEFLWGLADDGYPVKAAMRYVDTNGDHFGFRGSTELGIIGYVIYPSLICQRTGYIAVTLKGDEKMCNTLEKAVAHICQRAQVQPPQQQE